MQIPGSSARPRPIAVTPWRRLRAVVIGLAALMVAATSALAPAMASGSAPTSHHAVSHQSTKVKHVAPVHNDLLASWDFLVEND